MQGCAGAVESAHHIFVVCAHFTEWRTAAAVELAARTQRKLEEYGIAVEEQRSLAQAATSLFSDNAELWPLKMSQFYLGQIPRISDFLTAEMLPDPIKRRKLSTHIASDWHTSSIRLAGRIFGGSEYNGIVVLRPTPPVLVLMTIR
ncbi:hypothetical protein C8J57DRAFT_1221587 [Mycena rebaudengoi]|nr:hypothetical protein C8J57DRAFT_1221587 [Mycena rebaudengoi]